MSTPELKPGDTVVALGVLSTTVALLAGVINGALVFWALLVPWWGVAAGAAAGGALGALIGMAIARLLYAAPDDHVHVIKTGPAALPQTLRTAFLGAITASAILGFGAGAILGGLALVQTIALFSIAGAVLLGLLCGVLSALL